MVRWILILACALTVAGCGSADEGDSGSPKDAYLGIEKQLVKGDASACESMATGYKNKLAASVQLFTADCSAVVKAVGKGLRDDPDLRTTSIDQVKVNGLTATLVAHSTYEGADVRSKVTMQKNSAGAWIIDGDQQLDDVAPSAPLSAYRDYSKAFRQGDGTRVCALSTERGKTLLSKGLPESHGGGSCAGAVPFLAVAASKLPQADVIGGGASGDSATLLTLQAAGAASWAFREVVMKRENGKWLFDHAVDIGIAPAPRAPSSPVT